MTINPQYPPVVGHAYEFRNGRIVTRRTVTEVHRAVSGEPVAVTFKNDFNKSRRVSIHAWSKWIANAEFHLQSSLRHHAEGIQRAIGGDVEIIVRSQRLGGEVRFVTEGERLVRKETADV